jgi:hypothetical protein
MKTSRVASTALPGFVIGAILMMVLPIPSVLLDLMLTVNIGLAILILITTILLKDSVDFSIFPSLLLVTTLTRLSLSVASTRLILIHGNGGHVIETFGHIVIGGSVVVGLVVFLILIVIQATVITHGAAGSPRSPPASPSTPCPASRWRSTPTSPRASSTRSRPGSAASSSPRKRTSTARWTAPRSSSRATSWPASSS